MRAKKHLGQNFLSGGQFIQTIVSSANISKNDTVLEIGPGKGVLTRELLKYAKKVVCVEKDADLIPLLSETFAEEIQSGRLEIIEGDIIDLLSAEQTFIKSPYKVVANIPYYITGILLRLLLSAHNQPASITLVVQKEVAERIVSRDKKESILSLSVKAYGVPTYIQKIPARYFNPKPKVDSAIIHIGGISRAAFSSPAEEDLFFNIMKAGFAHKRKLLAGNLSDTYGKETVRELFITCAIPEKARAEDLPLEKWLCLTQTHRL